MSNLWEDLFGPTVDLGPARAFYGPMFEVMLEADRTYPERVRAYLAEQERLKAEMPPPPKAGFWERLTGWR